MSEPNDHLHALRHTAEHVLTQAMYKLYPGIKMAMGPAIEDGFYFDFDPGGHKISGADFPKIEKEMQKIIKQNLPLRRDELDVKEARKLFKGNEYKQEWLDEIEQKGDKASVYWTGEQFIDLCAGPHVKSTKEIKAFKLLSIAGAYWRGDEKNKMLTRIYGTAFDSKKALDEYLELQEEAKKRDHRTLGQQLGLFIFDEEVGQGLPLYLPKGAWLMHLIRDFAFITYLKRGYQPVSTPHIASNKLWQHSGHLNFYREGMYNGFGIEKEEYRLKPMNCPFHVRMYLSRKRSYRELPIRWTEMGTVYRCERSGTLLGLTRVRGFTQDDAHIICTPEQLPDEILTAFELTLYMLKTFGFEKFEVNLSVRDPNNKGKYIGNDKEWEMAENTLKSVLKRAEFENFVYDIGGAVFYGPKIDIKVADSIGRKWQLSTIQFDFNLPGRFNMTYIGSDGKEHVPYMVHRALLGSLDRFIGVLIEHYAGSFPVWLSPVQVIIIPISQEQNAYTSTIGEQLKKASIRFEIDHRDETMQAKIRDAQLEKVPYMLIIGKKEAGNDSVSVRLRSSEDLGEQTLEKFIDRVKEKIESKSLEL